MPPQDINEAITKIMQSVGGVDGPYTFLGFRISELRNIDSNKADKVLDVFLRDFKVFEERLVRTLEHMLKLCVAGNGAGIAFTGSLFAAFVSQSPPKPAAWLIVAIIIFGIGIVSSGIGLYVAFELFAIRYKKFWGDIEAIAYDNFPIYWIERRHHHRAWREKPILGITAFLALFCFILGAISALIGLIVIYNCSALR